MTLELYDAQYTAENADGSQMSSRFLPTNKVILSSTGDDNNVAAYDFGNAVVAESMLGSDASLVIGGALGNIADGAAYDALRAALTSKDAKVRRAAAEALGDRR